MSDVLEITLQSKGMNALGTPLLEAVRDELRGAGSRPILLLGAPPSFSAGLNLKEVVGLDDAGMRSFLVLLDEVCERLFSHPAPTVAAVDGHAIAGGAVLARCCDVAVGRAGGRGRVGLNEVAIGLRFPPRILRMMTAKLPRRHHVEVLLGAGLHRPENALQLGLLDELSEDPEATARARLAALAAHPADAYAAAKAALYAGVTEVSDEEQRTFADEVVPVWTSDAVKARIRAILG
jgi:enoyl-CoA hydratase/carnithine racemase